jgi:hypothetical protein
MPALEYLLLAEYVRQDGNLVHIMAAGLDTVQIPEGVLPAAIPAGAFARISFSSRDDVGTEHDIKLVFQGPSGDDLLTVSQRFPAPARPPDLPEHWRPAISIVFRLALPITEHGAYRLQVMLDDDPTMSRSVDVRAIEPDPGRN